MFGQLIVEHRQRLGLTQEELAETAGLSVRTIRDLESGRVRAPRQASVRLLADAFGLRGVDRELFHRRAGGQEGGRPGDQVVPAQLPADVPVFTGRRTELAELDALLAEVEVAPVVISAVSGTAGVGKTALALHWAHRVGNRFPDGHLYLNLRGYDPGKPVHPSEALTRLLAALGVKDTPVGVDALAAEFRTRIAGRRMLILLDNAATVEQVRPLLPGTGPCVVLVTSRDRLAGLVAVHGAPRIDLDPLPVDDAYALLRRLIGARLDAEPDAATALIQFCARLPLALRVAAELAVSRSTTSVAALASELSDQRRRLQVLDAGGDPLAAMAGVFSWSVRHLLPEVADVFRSLGLHPGPDFDAYAVAALAGVDLPHADRALEHLARAHLVHSAGDGRYGMHDLLRAYAAELAAAEQTEQRRQAAVERLFDYYVAAVARATDTLYPAEAHRRPHVPPPGLGLPDLHDPGTARTWLDTERPCLVSVAVHAATTGRSPYPTRLSTLLFRYLSGGSPTDALAIHGHARDAAARAGDRTGQAHALLGLGATYMLWGRFTVAKEHLEEASTLLQLDGDLVGQARALANIGIIEDRLGHYPAAADRHRQALALYRQAGDRTGEAYAHNDLGTAEGRLGNYEQAADHHRQALALCRQADDRAGAAYSLHHLSDIEMLLGQEEAAAEHNVQALDLFRQVGNRHGEAWALSAKATIHTRQREHERAVEHHRKALEVFREVGDGDGEAWVLNALGEATLAAGRAAEALIHHAAALAAATVIASAEQRARAHAGLGHSHRGLANTAAARTHYEHALALYTGLGAPQAAHVHSWLADLDSAG